MTDEVKKIKDNLDEQTELYDTIAKMTSLIVMINMMASKSSDTDTHREERLDETVGAIKEIFSMHNAVFTNKTEKE
jgi:hypothetical protein